MLNLVAPRVLTFLVSVVRVGRTGASLYSRRLTIVSTAVKVRTVSFVGITPQSRSG